MQFPYNVFSDLLAEFQKYLSSRIPQAVYWTLGLVVITLGIIVSYIVGWNTVLRAWNLLDVYEKLVLSGGTALIFLLTAYVLGSLQGTIERWFQGDWPLRLGKTTGRLKKHREIWQGRENAFQEMADLYGKISAALKDIQEWGQWEDPEKRAVRTTRSIPRYAIITGDDLATTFVDTVPDGALQDLSLAVGTMAQSPLAANTLLTNGDVISSPGWHDIVITAIAIPPEMAPLGLISGDMIVIYARQADGNLVHLDASLIVAVQHITRKETEETQAHHLHLTLAITASNGEALAAISDTQIVRIIRLNSQRISRPPAQAQRNAPSNATAIAPSPLDEGITRQINQLKQQYEAGELWLQQLRSGDNPEVPDHMQTLNEAFALIEQAGNNPDTSSVGKDQLARWRGQVNTYRGQWVSLLQDAFNEMQYRVDQNQKAFSLYYPSTLEKVAPTAIGNVLRTVDSYCDTLYGVDSALVLPRLQAVMEQSTRTQLSKAHTQLTLLEWLCLGSIIVGGIGTLLAFFSHHYLLAFVLWFMALPVPQLVFYSAAVSAALDYAAALRLAVDRERGKVLKMFGFSLPSPADQEQEKALWKGIQQWWVYGAAPESYSIASGEESDEKST